VALVFRDLLQRDHSSLEVVKDTTVQAGRKNFSPGAAIDWSHDGPDESIFPGRADRCAHLPMQFVAGIVEEEFNRTPNCLERLDVVNREIATDAQEPRRIKTIQEGVVEGMPPVDKDKIERPFHSVEQKRQGRLRLALNEAEEVDAGPFQRGDSDGVP